MPDPKTSQNMGISAACRVSAAAAFVVDPPKPMDIPNLLGDLKRKQIFEAIRAATIKAIATRIPEDVPPGTGEAAYPGMEHSVSELSSKDFFLKTLDRQHYPDGVGMDNRGNPVEDQGNRIDKYGNRLNDQGRPIKPTQPQQQVSNATSTTLASSQKP